MKLDIQRFAVTKSTTFSESNISIENNTSTLKITINFSANNTSTWFTSETLYCTCNGVTKSAQVSHSKGGSVTKTFTFNNIKHNTDGTKTVAWSWNCNTGTSVLGNISASGTRTLTTINRYGYIKNISGNTTDSTIAITYESTNSNYDYYLEIYKGHPDELGDRYKTYDDLDSSLGEHTLNISVESDYFNDYINSTSVPITYILWTERDDGSDSDGYYTYINLNTIVMPSGIIYDAEELNQTMISLDWDIFVQNKSQIKIPVEAEGVYGSTITSVVLYFGTTLLTGVYDSLDEVWNFNIPIVETSGQIGLTAVITDSRGRQKATIRSITIQPYTNPTITSVEAQRCLQDGTINEDGRYVKYTFVGSISSVANNNSKIFQIGYKKTIDENYTFVTISNTYSVNENDSVSSFTISPDYAYDIIFQAVDSFMTTAIGRHLTVGYDLMNFNSSGRAMAIGKVSEAVGDEGKFEVALPSFFYSDLELNNVNIYNHLFYNINDVVEIGSTNPANMYEANGFVTSSSKDIYITLPMQKDLSNITTITVNSFEVQLRSIEGYLEGSQTQELIGMTNVTVSADKSSDNSITFVLNKSNGWKNSSNANVTNNTPISIIGYIELTLT